MIRDAKSLPVATAARMSISISRDISAAFDQRVKSQNQIADRIGWKEMMVLWTGSE